MNKNKKYILSKFDTIGEKYQMSVRYYKEPSAALWRTQAAPLRRRTDAGLCCIPAWSIININITGGGKLAGTAEPEHYW